MTAPVPVRASRRGATLIGAGAIVLWTTLAPLAVATKALPPFLLMAVAFAIGGILLLLRAGLWEGRIGLAACLLLPPRIWALGLFGLFGYHALYFLAFRAAPAVEVNLVNYLWPLLIVLGSALLPGERLRPAHVLGTVLGLAGASLLVLRDGADSSAGAVPDGAILGYLAAFAAALTWASFSLMSRRVGEVRPEATAGFCLGTAALAFATSLALEDPAAAASALTETATLFALLAIGAGPLGLAFFAWDIGVKRGDIQTLGALSYLTPLLSTLLLVATGLGTGSAEVWLACILIVGGAVIATRAGLSQRSDGP